MDKNTTLKNLTQTFLPVDVAGIEPLIELALDLRWSSSLGADALWQHLDPELWDLTRNAWIVLKTVSRDKLRETLRDPTFRKILDDLAQRAKQDTKAPTWFQETHPKSPLSCVAYFSMEYMLSEALPIYSGGLGNVAGDQLKAASDLGVPVVAIGLLYQQGYFRQVIGKDGWQEALYPYNEPGQLPITPLRTSTGEWLRIEIPLPGWSVWLRLWQVKVGRVHLYLLDTNDAANYPAHRGITSELYGGGSELRLKQELVLGIGGWRVLEAMGLKPEVCHLNEGHAAFAVLERAQSFMRETGVSFEVALAATRAGNLFTTHTAVPAGFDRFPPALIEQYLGSYTKDKLGISLKDLLALGRQNPNDPSESFNMAYLAVRGSGAINGVSHLHRDVSHHLFQSLFPQWPEIEVPIGYVTNGVHMPTWMSPEAHSLWKDYCGKTRWLGKEEGLAQGIQSVPDSGIWQLRNSVRQKLVDYTRKRLSRQLAARGADPSQVAHAQQMLDPHTLTLGFARRFATYKRPNLLLHDPERLLRILNHASRPVQLIIAGKAHPADKPGQAMIQQWMQFIQRSEARSRVVFLSDYDILVTQQLVHGVDVWVNTPRRPWEACGTSGMKVLPNGGLNLSELDGWWAEAYATDVGWALGDGHEHGEDPVWDAAEALALYDLLEHEVIPEFYTRNADGIPTQWIARVRASMTRLTPAYSAARAVIDYTEKYYIPSAKAYLERAANKGAIGQIVVQSQHTLEEKWTKPRFGEVKIETQGGQYIFEAYVYLDGLDPHVVDVELYADPHNGSGPVRQPMQLIEELKAEIGTYVYRGAVSTTRAKTDYTPRVIPRGQGMHIPLEAHQILWQR